MRPIAFASWLLPLALACRPATQDAAAARTPSPGDGRIPITTRSADARALFLRGRALNENLQPLEARALFEQVVAIDPAFAFGEYSLATVSPTAKEIDKHLAQALALASTASTGERWLIQGFQARRQGDPARARQLADSLVVRYPQDERAHWTLGNACAAAQQYDCAIAEFRAAIRLDPAYSLAYNQLGYAYRGAGRLAEAESAFKRYIALVPNDPNPYDSYAELLMKWGRFDESIVQYRKALAIDGHFTGSFVGIAADEMYAGRYPAAIAEAERYLAMARDDRERRLALLTLAMIHVDRGATDEALAVLERRHALVRAIGDTVEMAADGVQMADVLLAAGRVTAAQARYTRAHGLLASARVTAATKQDDALAARYDAARVALAMGDLATARVEALAYATEATARHNDVRVRQAHELNGSIAIAARRFDEALSELAQADQQDPAVWAARARAYAGFGDMAKASASAAEARNMNILPTFAYVFTRAALAASTRSATSRSAGGTPR